MIKIPFRSIEEEIWIEQHEKKYVYFIEIMNNKFTINLAAHAAIWWVFHAMGNILIKNDEKNLVV